MRARGRGALAAAVFALVFAWVFALAPASSARAQTGTQLLLAPVAPDAAVPVELSLFDAPYNLHADLDSPSMGQSLALSSGAYALMHGAVAQYFDPWGSTRWRRLLGRGLVATADLVTMLLPPFLAWEHEEWHRAVLSRRRMDSYDDIYNFNLLASVVAVSHVKDEDLVRLKAEHPADQVRLSTAGIEGNYALAHHLESQAFFADDPGFHQVLVALLYLSNTLYLHSCSTSEADRITDDENAADGIDVPRRDFTGLDCTAWVYDLHRPDEPYAARGVHPSGVGIDRYRKNSDLSDDERSYLRQQVLLSLLNLLDPYLIGSYGFQLAGTGPPLLLNLSVRHLPTSFGYVIRGDLALRLGKWKALLLQQNYVNGQRWLPGLDLSLLQLPLWQGPAGSALELSARVAGWLQPARQRFDDDDASLGGLLGLRLALRLHPRVAPFVEGEAKSAGWVVGNVALERDLSVRAGLQLRVF